MCRSGDRRLLSWPVHLWRFGRQAMVVGFALRVARWDGGNVWRPSGIADQTRYQHEGLKSLATRSRRHPRRHRFARIRCTRVVFALDLRGLFADGTGR